MRILTVILGIMFSWHLVAETVSPETPDSTNLAIQVLEQGVTALDPVGVMAWVEMPRTAKIDETLVLKITIENGRESRPFKLESIDISAGIVNGFELKSIRPKPITEEVFLNSLTLEYSLSIPSGETVEFKLGMIAKRDGVHIAEVDIWEGDNFLTRVAQCRVTK